MTSPNRERVNELFHGVLIGVSRDGLPRVAPDSTSAVARVCETAHRAGLKIRIEGRGAWLPTDAPADLSLTTERLNFIEPINAADLVATVGAGMTLEAMEEMLHAESVTWPVDPPGGRFRSVGSIVATGTSGPRHHSSGPIRDQILGCTFVTGPGSVVTVGGRVPKNVAGYDLTRLLTGSFGGFGIITELNLRLRTLPQADLTMLAVAERDTLTRTARVIYEADAEVAALELLSPGAAGLENWCLAVRIEGSEEIVGAGSRAVERLAGTIAWRHLAGERAARFWGTTSLAMATGELALRFGVLAPGLDELLDLIERRLGPGLITAGAGRGGLRWVGDAAARTILDLRATLAQHEIPVTLERASWPLRHVIGHFGAYREGVGPLVARIRDRLDPGGQFAVALEGTSRG